MLGPLSNDLFAATVCCKRKGFVAFQKCHKDLEYAQSHSHIQQLGSLRKLQHFKLEEKVRRKTSGQSWWLNWKRGHFLPTPEVISLNPIIAIIEQLATYCTLEKTKIKEKEA